MTLTLRPPGRGNWKPVTLIVTGTPHLPPPMYFARGQRIELGGMWFRVSKVTP